MNWNREKIRSPDGISKRTALLRKIPFYSIKTVQKQNKAGRNTLQGGVVTSIIGDGRFYNLR